MLRFGPAPPQSGEATWQGNSSAAWQVNGRPLIVAMIAGSASGNSTRVSTCRDCGSVARIAGAD